MKEAIRLCTCLFLTAFALAGPVAAQSPGAAAKESKEEKPKTIAELVADSDRVDGLFTLFRDRKTGQVRMLVRRDQLDKEFIYFAQSSNGLPQVGFIVRGTYLVNDVITDRVEFVAENTSFYFNPDSPLARARDANQISSLLAVEKIAAEDEKTGEILIEADKLFLTQSLYQVKPSPDPEADPKNSYSLGDPRPAQLSAEYRRRGRVRLRGSGAALRPARGCQRDQGSPQRRDPCDAQLHRHADRALHAAACRSAGRLHRRAHHRPDVRQRHALPGRHRSLEAGQEGPDGGGVGAGGADRVVDREHHAAGVARHHPRRDAGLELVVREGRLPQRHRGQGAAG